MPTPSHPLSTTVTSLATLALCAYAAGAGAQPVAELPFADEKRWAGQHGLEGAIASESPLDELSFLYYLRTLPLTGDSIVTMTRHFDSARNPTVVTVIGREEIDVGAGRFRAVIVEMRVRDTRRYRGEGVLRIHLSDDKCRLILRLESNVPSAGKATLALAAYSGMRCNCTAQIR